MLVDVIPYFKNRPYPKWTTFCHKFKHENGEITCNRIEVGIIRWIMSLLRVVAIENVVNQFRTISSS